MTTLNVVYTGTRPPECENPELNIRHEPMLEVDSLDFDVERLLELLSSSATVVFYSKNAVNAVADKLRDLPDFDPSHHDWWAVGDKTAEQIHDRFGVEARVPKEQNFQGVLEEFCDCDLKRHVIALSLDGKDRDLSPALSPRSIAFSDIPVYETRPADHENLEQRLRGFDTDWIIFTSPRGVRNFLAQIDEDSDLLDHTHIAAIGPTTADALRDNDLSVDLIPDEPGTDELFRQISR